MLLGEKNGLFVTHQGCMATHFAHFLQMGWQDNRLNTSLHDFSTIDKPQNIIQHKNEHIQATAKEIDLDLSTMDKVALQDVYEDLTCILTKR